MIIENPPILPFPDFKWRWASVAPTEGLNEPKVFLGALRAFLKFEGVSPNSPELMEELQKVQDETGTTVDLVRNTERNLIRNSGQYWKAFGLLIDSDPVILLSQFGRDVASGSITMPEFALTAIAAMELPNPRIQNNFEAWIQSGIRFKPLELLIEILSQLKKINIEEGYITKTELIRIIEPISAISTETEDFVETLLAFRTGNLSIQNWPNCAPNQNDHRMAGEFLLFLELYGYCSRINMNNSWNHKYVLENIDDVELKAISNIATTNLSMLAESASHSGMADTVERQRISRQVLSRPQQAAFRKAILMQSGCSCLITGTEVSAALEAAHIIPVSENGSDQPSNGFCLRSDIHTLFDNGHIRLTTTGALYLSKTAKADPVYRNLPDEIAIPAYVNLANVQWRWSYM